MQGSGSVPYTPAPVTAPLYQPAGFGQPPATVPLYQPQEPFQQSAPKLGQITLASGNDVRPMAAPQVSAPELEGDEEDYRPRPSTTPAISTKPPPSGSGLNPPSLDQLRITEASSFSHVPPLSGTPPGAIPRMSVPPPTAEQLTQPAAPVHPAVGPSSVNQFNPPSGLQSQGFTDFEGGNAQPYGVPSSGANPYTPMVGSRPLPPAASPTAPQMNYSAAPTPTGVASPSFTGGFGADAVSLTPRDEWQAPDEFLAPTLRFVPQTDSLLETSGLPFGVVIRPLSPVGRTEPAVHPIQEGQATVPIPVIDYRGGSSIIRCRRCRCYMNPFATFSDGGKRWKCNLCYLLDDGKSFIIILFIYLSLCH
jgi:protein transport protein SEC24